MPVMTMATSENEVKEKTPKAKKACSDPGAGSHRIIDFFKPHTKEGSPKQKSLLQFFSKPAASKLADATSEECIQISSVDKENLDVDPETIISLKEAGTLVSGDNQVESNGLSEVVTIEGEKSDQKSQSNETGEKPALDDSVVIISDTSCDSSAFIDIDASKDGISDHELHKKAEDDKDTDFCEVNGGGIGESKKPESDKLETDIHEDANANAEDANVLCIVRLVEKESSKETNTPENAEVHNNCEKATDNFKVPRVVKKTGQGLKLPGSDSRKVQTSLSSTDNDAKECISKGSDEIHLKTTLSGKEMMSLLKEVQEPDGKKKKKHKHKHKKKSKEKEHIEHSEDDEKKTKKERHLEDSNTTSESSVSHKKSSKKLVSSQTDNLCVLTKEIEENRTKKDVGKQISATVRTEKVNYAVKQLDKESNVNEDEDIKSSNDCSTTKTHQPCEMSYADFLKKMESTTSEENMEVESSRAVEINVDSDSSENTEGKEENIVEIRDIEAVETKVSELIDTEELKRTCDNESLVKSPSQSSQSSIAQFFASTAKKVNQSVPPMAAEVSEKKPIKKKTNKKAASDKSSKQKEAVSNTSSDCLMKEPQNEVSTTSAAKQKHKFLSESSRVVMTGCSKQATLSFGASGLTMAKPVVKSENLSKCSKGKSKKSQVKSKSCSDTDDSDNACLNDAMNKSKVDEVNQLKEESNTEECKPMDEITSEDSNGRRRSTRKKYQVSGFQLDVDKKTPIKIKLKRCVKNESCGEDIKAAEKKPTKKELKTVKQTKAQALLEKAKMAKHKKKVERRGRPRKQKLDTDQFEDHGTEKDISKKVKQKRSDRSADAESADCAGDVESGKEKQKKKKRKMSDRSTDSDSGCTRRSSRLEGKTMPSMEEVSLENIVISSDEEEPVRKRGRPKIVRDDVKPADGKSGTSKNSTPKKGTPKKQDSAKSPSKKAGVKLAPMFLMGKKGAKASPKKPPLDPEQMRQRQEFLMSGVPDEVKKQTATRIASMPVADYPPLPKVNHVQQRPEQTARPEHSRGQVDVWNLQPVELQLRELSGCTTITPVSTFTGTLMSAPQADIDVGDIRGFSGHKALEEPVLGECQGEVNSYNPSYPVHRMFQALKRSSREMPAVVESAGADTKPVPPEVVVIDEEDEPKPRRRGRSLKLAKKAAQEEYKLTEEPKQSDNLADNKSNYKGPCLLWTDKYQPVRSTEVLGNSGVLKKLKSWLTEWKHVLDREARKARKLLLKKNKGKQQVNKDDDVWDDDSDFDLSSDDSEEDESLCNTMLLSGPHGCGKTSSVYALAQEVGFKVHEVNASSSRSGKHILSQLQEATQSHQVSSKSSHSPTKQTANAAPKKPDMKMSAAFTNLFNKASNSNPDDSNKSKKRKKTKSEKEERKRQKKEGGKNNRAVDGVVKGKSGDVQASNMNLSSTTLILFDEVDVVFDEDKGFLNAVQTFMSTTKIPIILTTADPSFNTQFDGRYELLTLRRPPISSLTSHLQTISLVENVRVDHEKLSELVHLCRGDVRKSLASMQYMVESGGGHTVSYRLIAKPSNIKKDDLPQDMFAENSQNSQENASSSNMDRNPDDVLSKAKDDDDDDFVILKPLKKRRRMFEDDNSNSMDKFTDTFKVKHVLPGSADSVVDDTAARACPPVHRLCIETMLGISVAQGCLGDAVIQALKAKSSEGLSELISLCDSMKKMLNTSPVYNNLPLVLPLTTQTVNSVSKPQTQSNKKEKKRKRIQNDLYDSEASTDGITSVEPCSDKGTETDPIDGEDKLETDKKDTCAEESKCLYESLSAFSRFYDSMCVADTLESAQSLRQVTGSCEGVMGSGFKGNLSAGVADELPGFRLPCSQDADWCRSYSSELEGRSAAHLYQEVDGVQSRVERLCEDNPALSQHFQLPVLQGSKKMSLLERNLARVPVDLQRVHDNSTDCLPLVVHKHSRNLHLDYLPILRDICRQESCRQMTNAKRRFHHYFDNIALPLKEKTMAVLATTLL